MNINNYTFYKYTNSVKKIYTFEDIVKTQIDKKISILVETASNKNYLVIDIESMEYKSTNALNTSEINLFAKTYEDEIKKIKRIYNINKLLGI